MAESALAPDLESVDQIRDPDARHPDGTSLVVAAPRSERNWMPLAIALGLVVVVVLAGFLMTGRGKQSTVTAINAPVDPYASNLAFTNLAMSESSNLAGSKVTYLDGHVINHGDRTVSGITVQVLFRNYAREVAQNETMPLTLIRMREPYVDTEPVSMAPLKPGAEHDFRLIFDNVSADWAGATPEVRVLRVQSK